MRTVKDSERHRILSSQSFPALSDLLFALSLCRDKSRWKVDASWPSVVALLSLNLFLVRGISLGFSHSPHSKALLPYPTIDSPRGMLYRVRVPHFFFVSPQLFRSHPCFLLFLWEHILLFSVLFSDVFFFFSLSSRIRHHSVLSSFTRSRNAILSSGLPYYPSFIHS